MRKGRECSSSELERGRGLSAKSREGKEGEGESALRGEEHGERERELKLWDLLKLERKETEQEPVSDSNNLPSLTSLPLSSFNSLFPSLALHITKEGKRESRSPVANGLRKPFKPYFFHSYFFPLLPLAERTFYP